MADAKPKLAAVPSADVAGYARHKGDDERATMDALGARRGRARVYRSWSSVGSIPNGRPDSQGRSRDIR